MTDRRNTPFVRFDPGDCLADDNPNKCVTVRSEVEASNVFALAAGHCRMSGSST
ncbi:hypothetical protein [Mesorhizobium sp. B2-4-15]|uniref:hypothetical protein n=1 Tax=Mesorhizobium sp. B2-4-15 TaxID=2589934 RepID=UPI0015EF059B|nr:hypothetical protein [Mesorhizobium sp. B2-4-15]